MKIDEKKNLTIDLLYQNQTERQNILNKNGRKKSSNHESIQFWFFFHSRYIISPLDFEERKKPNRQKGQIL